MLQRRDPFRELRRMEDNMNRLWRGFGTGIATDGAEIEGWTLPLDVVEEGDKVVVHASMPGIKPEDIEVSIDDNVLTIKGHAKAEEEKRDKSYLMRERWIGSFHRSVRLPDSANAEKAESSYEHGVLTVSVPKVEQKKAKRLEIKVNKAIEGTKS